MSGFLVEMTDHSFKTPAKFYLWHGNTWGSVDDAKVFVTRAGAQVVVRQKRAQDRLYPARNHTYRVVAVPRTTNP